MKKLLPYCFLVLLFLFTSCVAKSQVESKGELGNTAGNIVNGGYVAENENFFFWATLGEDKIYKSNKDFSENKEIFEGKFGVTEINVADGYIYFTDGTPGYLRKMTIDGKKSKILTFSHVENVIVSGERIYYKTSEKEYGKEKVYSCDLNGRNRIFLAKNVSQFCIDGETIYYTKSDDRHSLWSMDLFGENNRKLNSEHTINPTFDDKYIYYTTAENFNIFRMDKENLQTECINAERCASINIYGDWIYYGTNRYLGPLCRMSKDGKTKEVLLNAPIAEINIVDNFVFYRLLENGAGRYRLDLKTGESTLCSSINKADEHSSH